MGPHPRCAASLPVLSTAVLPALASALGAGWHQCPAAVSAPADALPTSCDQNATCCQHPFSNSGVGCCPLGSRAVCCGGFTCCPEGTECLNSGKAPDIITKCVHTFTRTPVADGIPICKPGPGFPLSKHSRNCLIIGDSVSIGFTPFVNALLNGTRDGCAVLHSPFAGDGGAEETAYGLQCLEYFLRSSDGRDILPSVDLVYFNWGLHNLLPQGAQRQPGQSGLQSEYLSGLTNITERLVKARAQLGVKILFGLTTPLMCDARQDAIVRRLNEEARALMLRESVPLVDTHEAVLDKCGAPPQAECLGIRGGGCPHYSAEGYAWLASAVLAPAFRRLLTSQEHLVI